MNVKAVFRRKGQITLHKATNITNPEIAHNIYNNGFPNVADAMSTFFPVIKCQFNQLNKLTEQNANKKVEGSDKL